MNVLLAIQKPSKHDRFVFDCILYKGNFTSGIILKRQKKTIYNYSILDSLDLREQLEDIFRHHFKLKPDNEVLVILGQKYNGYTFWLDKEWGK